MSATATAAATTPAASPPVTSIASTPTREPDPAAINRELSILAFNRRVLALAEDPATPLLERLRFLCIVSSNLDEFFEIRVAGLREQLRLKAPLVGTSLQELRTNLVEISEGAQKLVAEMYGVLNGQILPALEAGGIRMLHHADRSPAQRAWVAEYFQHEIRPLLTPIGLDPAHPFPQVVNKSLNFIVELSGRDAFGRETAVAIVKAPRLVPRVIKMPPEVAGADNTFVLLSSIMHTHLHELFAGREVVNYSQFRVTRDADLWIDEEEVKNLRQALEGELPQRQFGLAVRLEVASGCPPHLAAFLLQQFELQDADLYRCAGPVNLARMSALIDQVELDALEYPPFLPGLPDRLRDQQDVFGAIRQHDILLHHPYQSFEPVVEFIRKAADDPDVVAIKQTVYRTGVNSVLMEALVDAAGRGKEVTVVVELMARFDEEANINWAELPSAHGAPLHGFRAADREPGDLRRRGGSISPYHQPRQGEQAEAAVARALHYAPPSPRRHPPRDAPRQGRQAGAHRRQDERLARGSRDQGALRGVAGRGEDRPGRPRCVRFATGRHGRVRQHPGSLGRRPFP